MISFQKRVYRSFALNFLTSDNEVVFISFGFTFNLQYFSRIYLIKLMVDPRKSINDQQAVLKKKGICKNFSRDQE